MVDPTPTNYVRSTSDQVAFWILWVLLLIPALALLVMTIGGGLSIVLVPLFVQLVIHGITLKWFLEMTKGMPRIMLMLLGGSILLYFLAFSGCVIMVFTA